MFKIKRIAIIDNNDSFTYNLAQLFTQCPSCTGVVIPYQELCLDDLASFDKIVFSAGAYTPSQYPKLFEVLKRYGASKPILGICLGHQLIAEHFGATLELLQPVNHGKQITLEVDPVVNSDLFANLPEQVQVGLYHSWAVSSHRLPAELSITAKDAQGTIMGLKHNTYPIESIQFHPESYMSPQGRRMLKNWINQ